MRGGLLSLLFLYSRYCGVPPVVSFRRPRAGLDDGTYGGNLPNAHGEGVDVFVQLVQQGDGLDDHVVRPVDVELDLGPGVAVTQPQLGLGGSQRGQALHQGVEMQTETWNRNRGEVGIL